MCQIVYNVHIIGFPGGSVGKESPCNARAAANMGSIPDLGKSPGEGHGNPIQYSCLENPMNRGAWQATVHRVAKSWTWLKWLSTHACMHAHNYIQNGHIHSFNQYYWVSWALWIQQWTEYQRLPSWSLYYGRQRRAVPKYTYTVVRCAVMKIEHEKGNGKCSVFYIKEGTGSEHSNTKEQWHEKT